MRLCLFVDLSSLIGLAPSNLYPFSHQFSHPEAISGALRSFGFQFRPYLASIGLPCQRHSTACHHGSLSPVTAASRRCLLAFLSYFRQYWMRWRRHQAAAVQTCRSIPFARWFRRVNLSWRSLATSATSCSSGSATSWGSSCSDSDSNYYSVDIANSKTTQYWTSALRPVPSCIFGHY